MKRKEGYRQLEQHVREVLRFERFYAPRLRAAMR